MHTWHTGHPLGLMWARIPLGQPWSSFMAGLIRSHILVFPPASPLHCCQTNGKNEGATSTIVDVPNTWTHPGTIVPVALLSQRQPAHTIWVQPLATKGQLPTMGQDNNSLLSWLQGLCWGEHTIERPWDWQVSPWCFGFAASWGIGFKKDLQVSFVFYLAPLKTPKD